MKLIELVKERFFWNHFVIAIAALSAGATLLTALFDCDWIKDKWYFGFIGAILVLAGSVYYASLQTNSKKKIILDLSSELKLTISEGDLFQQKGVICIPFNEYFDTHVGDGVVGEGTIHGKFINKYFKDRIPELNGKIADKLSGFSYQEHKRRLDFCPNKKYELGTCIDIRDGENTYVLFALTHFNDQDKANVGRAEYTEVVVKLMSYLSDIVEGRPAYMPLFGAGLSRLRRTPQRIFLQLVNTIDFDDKCNIPGGVNIIVDSLKETNVNLTMLEYIIKRGITEDEK